MQIAVQNFINNVIDGNFVSSEMETSYSRLISSLTELINDFRTTVIQSKLCQSILMVNDFDEEVQIRLESGVINLPFANINRVDNFFENLTQEVPLKMYLIIEANDLNVSKFRIDEVSSLSELAKDPQRVISKVQEMVTKAFAKIKVNLGKK